MTNEGGVSTLSFKRNLVKANHNTLDPSDPDQFFLWAVGSVTGGQAQYHSVRGHMRMLEADAEEGYADCNVQVPAKPNKKNKATEKKKKGKNGKGGKATGKKTKGKKKEKAGGGKTAKGKRDQKGGP